MRRAQLAIEFVIIVAMAFIIGALFLTSAADIFQRMSDRQRVAALNDVGYRIQDEVILATVVQDGYERTFTVPAKADRFTYGIDSQATRITLTSGTVAISYGIPEIDGAVAKGTNTITKGADGVTVT